MIGGASRHREKRERGGSGSGRRDGRARRPPPCPSICAGHAVRARLAAACAGGRRRVSRRGGFSHEGMTRLRRCKAGHRRGAIGRPRRPFKSRRPSHAYRQPAAPQTAFSGSLRNSVTAPPAPHPAPRSAPGFAQRPRASRGCRPPCRGRAGRRRRRRNIPSTGSRRSGLEAFSCPRHGS